MGRRIYEEDNFVWKYTFGRQSINMMDYSEEYSIGEYIIEKVSNDGEEYRNMFWIVNKNIDLAKLKNILKTFSSKTRRQLNNIGMKALKKHIEKQNNEWKENFKEYIETINKAKSEKDFGCFGVSIKQKHFDIYDIYALAIEEHLKDVSFDFYRMTEAFIDYISSKDKEDFQFNDEY